MEPSEPTRIVRFVDGRELTDEEAQSGDYCFIAYRDENFAFDLGQADEQVAEWAEQYGVEDALVRAQETVDALPEDPRAAVDEATERAEVERLAKRVEEFARRRDTPNIGDPDFLDEAHREGVLESAMLFLLPGRLGAAPLTIQSSLPDLLRVRAWPGGARSIDVDRYTAVALYTEPNYVGVPLWRLIGPCKLADTQRGIFSVLFTA